MLHVLADNEDRKYISDLLKSLDFMSVLDFGDIKRQLNNVSFAITSRCNLRCTHYIVDASYLGANDKYSTEQIFDVLDKIKSSNPNVISITGGNLC